MKFSNEFSVGLFALLALAMFFLGFKYLKGVDFFSSTKKYYALYSNIDGLNKSNPVIINGVSVGRVSDIEFIDDKERTMVVVQMDIEGDISLGDSARAILINQDVLGSKAIRLDLGRVNDNVRKDGDTLISIIDRSITDQLLDNVTPVTNDLSTVIGNINELVENINSEKGKVDTTILEVIATIRDLRSDLNTTFEKVDSAVGSINRLSDGLVMTNDNLQPTIKNVEELTAQLKNIDYEKTINSIDSLSAELKVIASAINKGEGTAGMLVNDSSLYLDLNQTIRDLDSLIVDLNRNPKKYINFSVFGGKDK